MTDHFRSVRIVMALAAAGLVAGCSSSTDLFNSTSLSRVFGGGSGTSTVQASADNPASAQDIECPGVEYRVGAASLSLTGPGEQGATNVKYLLSFAQTARECRVSGGTVTMKVGIEGRVVLGPIGAPGPVNVPLRYAVVREGAEPKTIITKFQQIVVDVPAGQGNVPFINIVDDLVFPVPPAGEIESYVVYVGFDPQGAPRAPAKKGPARKTPPKKQAVLELRLTSRG